MKMVRILLVDDHPIIYDGLAQLIAHKGRGELEIIGAERSAEDALATLRRVDPDMLIVDIFLQGTDGIELVKRARAQKADIKILVFSMYDESLYAERASAAGADGYVMKHAEPSEIFKAVSTVAKGEVYFSRRILSRLIRKESRARGHALSDREMETFRLLGLGWTTHQIADELHLSIKTVETYCSHIKLKLGLRNFNELIQRAAQWIHT